MKRGGPLRRKTALKPGTKGLGRVAPLKRSAPIEKGKRKPLKTRARKVIDHLAAEAWAKYARSKPCAVCKRKRGVLVRGHHGIYQQELERLAKRAGREFESLRWDRRNCLPLCDGCHERHHSGARKVRMSVLREHCPKVFQFADEIDRDIGNGAAPARRFLEQRYPDVNPARPEGTGHDERRLHGSRDGGGDLPA